MEIVYLETTFFSFFHDERTAPAIVAMRDWTRQFWEERRDDYALVTSAAVLDELRKGGAHHKKPALDLALALPLVPAGEEIIEVVRTYVEHKVMPQDPTGDALHLALASFHGCDYLVTWNCRHLANANKFGHIRRVNAMLGLKTPELGDATGIIGKHRKMNAADQAIEEIRAVRQRISTEHGHDITKYLASLRMEEKQHAAQLKRGEKLLTRRQAENKKYPALTGKMMVLRDRSKK